jgi:hypothetical protein
MSANWSPAQVGPNILLMGASAGSPMLSSVEPGVDQHVDFPGSFPHARGRFGRRHRRGGARLVCAIRGWSAHWRLQCVCP